MAPKAAPTARLVPGGCPSWRAVITITAGAAHLDGQCLPVDRLVKFAHAAETILLIAEMPQHALKMRLNP